MIFQSGICIFQSNLSENGNFPYFQTTKKDGKFTKTPKSVVNRHFPCNFRHFRDYRANRMKQHRLPPFFGHNIKTSQLSGRQYRA